MKKLFITLVILLAVISCGGPSDDSDGGSNIPVITDVRFYTPPDFNPDPEFEFNIGDEFNIIVYATDYDLDMETLTIAEYCVDSLMNICNGPTDYGLPEQVGVERGYHFANDMLIGVGDPFAVVLANATPGAYEIEFQIEDRAGHISNIFQVVITVNPVKIVAD